MVFKVKEHKGLSKMLKNFSDGSVSNDPSKGMKPKALSWGFQNRLDNLGSE